MAATVQISLENPILQTYLFYVSLLVLKMLAMSILTSRQRMKNNVFISSEDHYFASKKSVVKPNAEDIERVRRAHLNDLENIPLFFVIGFIYILTDPSVALATWLYRVYTAARFIHTFVYAIHVVPQPARALAWGAGLGITGYMAVQSAFHFL